MFGLCPHPASSACLVAFLGRSGCVLSLCPQLVSCGHFWVALALIWAVSSACVLLAFLGRSGSCSGCVLILRPRLPGGLSGSLGLCPQPVSSACVLWASLGRSGPCLGCVLSLCPQFVSCGHVWVALALIWAVSSACVLSLCPAGLSGSLWLLFGLCPQPVSSACVLPSMNDAVKHAPGRLFFSFF